MILDLMLSLLIKTNKLQEKGGLQMSLHVRVFIKDGTQFKQPKLFLVTVDRDSSFPCYIRNLDGCNHGTLEFLRGWVPFNIESSVIVQLLPNITQNRTRNTFVFPFDILYEV